MSRGAWVDDRAAVAFIRAGKESHIFGPDAQRAAIKLWATSSGVQLVGLFEDFLLVTAALEEREGALLVIARNEPFRRPVVVELERLTLTRLITVDSAGKEFGAARGRLEPDQIRNRVREALAAKTARGERVGGVPYGSKTEGATLVPEPAERAVIERVRALRADGRSCAWIASRLTAEGPAPRSGGRWHPTQIRRMLVAVDETS